MGLFNRKEENNDSRQARIKRIELGSPALQADSLPSEPPGKPLSPLISCFQEQVKALLGRIPALRLSH